MSTWRLCLIMMAMSGQFADRLALGQCAFNWSNEFVTSGVNGDIFAMTTFDDGTGPALFIGGSFTTVGGVQANRWVEAQKLT